ncbi:replicative DNA helicase [Pseudomonas shirazica]|uniref:replicative DNA helicase n=1 Tax=Pseudomonas shirazica TaxID=1940636 RepID=UPI0025A9B5DD|nr:replicative DNA helicase [Pseudomonas shirazica]MDM9598614.1 replicative DNA helicase [Pseudomonas shirazica]MDO2412042.1 replicative DNA helicase [Pseudomonas shirazica]
MSELVMGYPEAEHGVLGAIMLASLDGNAALVDDIVSQMTSADFLYDDHAALFDVIRDCLERGLPVDAVTVGDVQRTLPSGLGTLAFAVDLCRNVPSVANAMAYAKQVKQWAVIRQVVDIGHSAKAAVASGLVPDEIIAQAQQSIADLRDLQGSEKAGYKRMAEVLPKVFDGMQEVLDDRAPPKLSTGLADLDKLIGFLRPKSMVVIAGRPGSGKTMLGLQIVNHVAIRGAGVGLIFSLEMDEKELTIRTIASQGGVDLRRMDEVKSLDEDEWQRIGTAGSKIEAAQLYLNDTPGMTMSAIRSEARKLQREHGLDILMIDYLGLVGTEGRNQNRADAVAKVSIALKNLAKELSVPVLVLAQLNRNPASRPGKKPQASDLRDSGQIEQDADAVILVHHDPESEAGEHGVTELILDKGRQAPQGSCLVQRQGQYARFVNFAGNRLPPDDEVEMGRTFAGRHRTKGAKHESF